MRIARTLPLLAVLAVVLAAGAQAKEPTVVQRIKTFKKTVRSKDPLTRSRAFDYLREAIAPAALEAIVWGVRVVGQEEGKIHQAQKDAEALYEKTINDLKEAELTFETSNRSSRDLDRYNKSERKISKIRDGAIKKLKNLENDFTRNRAMLQQAEIVGGEILMKLPEEELEEGLRILAESWLLKRDLANKLRWLDTVADVDRPRVTSILHALVDDATQPLQLRTGSVAALASRRDGGILGKAIEMLKLPVSESGMLVAAIAAIRRLHDRRGIKPLMQFLGRDDIKRSRDDARNALISLTGKDAGAYPGEWLKWWEDNEKTFVMPKDPMPPGNTKGPEKGSSFYGIHTFSDRILYIVDISGSMDRPQKGKDAAGKTKMQVCQEELTSAVYKLNDGDGFNVIFFNHQVIPWQNKKVIATDKTKKMLQKWVQSQTPLGGTNIFDALERGFMLAAFGTTGKGRPPIDTIYFLTDGKPTAGKIQDPEKILEVIREWNKTAKLTIHCVGIGKDHDAEFLKELAKIGDGRYVAP